MCFSLLNRRRQQGEEAGAFGWHGPIPRCFFAETGVIREGTILPAQRCKRWQKTCVLYIDCPCVVAREGQTLRRGKKCLAAMV